MFNSVDGTARSRCPTARGTIPVPQRLLRDYRCPPNTVEVSNLGNGATHQLRVRSE